ncbi:ABC transporter ATP-binding protein [Dermabacteraceae bacterium P13077]
MTDKQAALSLRGITLGYGGGADICRDISLEVPRGSFTVILGPNACGKSTVLKAMARLLSPRAGEILLEGRELAKWPTGELARHLGLLPQSAIAPDGIRVVDLVARGRSPHQGLFSRWSAEDERVVAEAMETAGVLDLSQRVVQELSGGQRQRVWLALLLAQQTDVLLLDEPTTFLDIAHQYSLLNLSDRLRREGGRTVVAVLHDLNQACRYATHLIVMKDGRVVVAGDPAEVMNAELVKDVYQLPCDVIPDPQTGTPMVVPHAQGHPAAVV